VFCSAKCAAPAGLRLRGRVRARRRNENFEFLWPGPDLRAIPGRDESTIAYGALPPRFFVHVRERFLERDRSEKSMRVARTE
jgi:hypothetical protein